MRAERTIATYRRLREQPFWRLLAADKGYIVAGLLQTHLLEGERNVPASVLFERLHRDLEELRAQGEDLPQTAQAYVAQWLAAGYVERRLPPGAGEEVYEISAAAEDVIRFLGSLSEPRATATESRLATVIQQLARLAEETDTNPESRIAALLADQERIQREIEAVRQGRLHALPDERALERIREILGLAEDLAGDFRRVRDRFEQLNRGLRERIVDNEGSRGEVLDALFAGVDVIAESDAGRTFAAFWRLLTDPEQSATLDEALGSVMSRGFSGQLSARERRFLLRLTRTLLTEGGFVHEVVQHFAHSLKQFVQSREYLEQRRITRVLKQAQRAALELKDSIGTADSVEYTLQLTSCRMRSVSQWVLYDPSLHSLEPGMEVGEPALIDLDTVGDLVAQSEIDFRTLRGNIRTVLDDRLQASIGDVLTRFPAAQGLGSVIGYVALGSRHGISSGDNECVEWQGNDGEWRRARIPTIYFLKERTDELA